MYKKALWLRNNASNFVAQFVDSTIFIFLAFYSLCQGVGSNVTFLLGLIIPSGLPELRKSKKVRIAEYF